MEYENAYKLKQKLLQDNEGKPLDELIKGEEISTSNGSCYKIENESNVKFNTLNSKIAKKKILSDLKILNGIGEVREQKLKENGYHTIEDLKSHEKYSNEASKFSNLINNEVQCEIEDWICRFYPKSHPLNLFSSSFSGDHDFIFLDIETLGLFNSPIILLGIAKVSENNINVKQYLSRSLSEEKSVLDAFISNIDPDSVFVTFNGQTFDLPFIRNRMRYFNLKKDVDHAHFDVLHYSRREWSEELMNCQLQTLEKHLFNIVREDDVPSGLVPEFYQDYIKTGNVGPIIPIIKHNEQDIITVAMIFSRLHEKYAEY
ncbi:MAG: ribonuclease H-like domain-containing protein [Methanobacterium sp.]